MSSSGPDLASTSSEAWPRPGWARWVWRVENGLLVFLLAAMVLVPIVEIVLQKILRQTGIAGSTAYLRHFTLLVGMLGGAVAARENKLLSLSTLSSGLKGVWRELAHVVSGIFAVGVAAILAWTSWAFVMKLRPTSEVLPYGVPIWVLQLAMPVGFALLAGRSWWHSSIRWRVRGLILVGAALLVWIILQSSLPVTSLRWIAMGGLVLATIFGAPLYVALGGAALILFWGWGGRPLTEVPNNHYDLVTNEILPSIPLFTLTGYFLAEGGASQRLVRVFQALVGQFRGGAAIVTALVCAFFTAFTGASGVTILALGSLLLPALLATRMSERSAFGLLTSAGSLGVLLPPCLPLILYSIIAQRTVTTMELPVGTDLPDVGIPRLFLAGILPGMLLVFLTAAWAVWKTPKPTGAAGSFDGKEAVRAFWGAKWELFLPIMALFLILRGWATPVQTAAATALYAFITQTCQRGLGLRRDVPRVMTECGLLVGGVLLILGVAMGLTAFMIWMDVPTLAVEWIQSRIGSKLVFLILLNLFLLVVGCLMDIFSAIIVVVPLIVPIGIAFGVDPVHLGIIFLANLQVGYITPPVGMNLFLASYRFNKPMPFIVRSILPILLVLLAGVLFITFVPALSLVLPNWFGKTGP